MATMTLEEEREYLAERAKRIEVSKLREAERIKTQPFKTMAEVSHPDTLNALRGWREPLRAYVLFELPAYHGTGNGAFRLGAKLGMLNIEHRPEQEHNFYYLIRKGGRPIHYGKFPTANDPDPKRQQLYRMHTGPDGINPFDEMARLVERTIQRNSGVDRQIAEKVGLEAKLEAERAEVKRLRAELEAKYGSDETENGVMASSGSDGGDESKKGRNRSRSRGVSREAETES